MSGLLDRAAALEMARNTDWGHDWRQAEHLPGGYRTCQCGATNSSPDVPWPCAIAIANDLLEVQERGRNAVRLYVHLKKRVFDEFGIDISEEWEEKVLAGEHDVPLREAAEAARRERDQLRAQTEPG